MLKFRLYILISFLLFYIGCATAPKPINYLSLTKPNGKIISIKHSPVEKKFDRGGWYFGNHNFRPAPDVSNYIKQVNEDTNTIILKNADVCLSVPFAIDILFFGYNSATDVVKVDGQ
jgi:hypothetical protein